MSAPTLEDMEKWIYICARCNSCKFIFRDYQDCCPAGNYFWFEPYWASGKNLMARELLEGTLQMSDSIAEKVFSCVLCGNCEQQCEQEIGDHLVEIFEALRAEAVKSGHGPMPSHEAFRKNVEKEKNPYGEPRGDRFAHGKIIEHMKDRADVVYFVGCTTAYREKDVMFQTISILEKMGVNFTIMRDEQCCGSPLLTTGQFDAAKNLAVANIENVKKTGASTIITSCAGCFRTLSRQYKRLFDLEFPAKVQHFSEYIAENMKRLKFKKPASEITVTYHDPCHLGRHGGVYEAPRRVLEQLPGVKLVEMPRNRENAWCCGAGAGVKAAFSDFARETSKKRIEEAERTGASTLVTCCPFCERNLEDGLEPAGSAMHVVDLCRLVDESSE